MYTNLKLYSGTSFELGFRTRTLYYDIRFRKRFTKRIEGIYGNLMNIRRAKFKWIIISYARTILIRKGTLIKIEALKI